MVQFKSPSIYYHKSTKTNSFLLSAVKSSFTVFLFFLGWLFLSPNHPKAIPAILTILTIFSKLNKFWGNWAILKHFEQILRILSKFWGNWAILSQTTQIMIEQIQQFQQFLPLILPSPVLPGGKPLLNEVLLVYLLVL